MFGLFEKTAKALLDTGDCLLSGEVPSKQDIAKLIDAGLTVYAISEATGIAVEVIDALTEGSGDE